MNIQRHGSTTIIDSILLADINMSCENKVPLGGYFVFYIGNITDTITLLKNPIISPLADGNDPCSEKDWTEIYGNKLTIYVDTMTTFTAGCPRLENTNDTIVNAWTKSYGLFVFNRSDSTVKVGRSSSFAAIRQVKSPHGEWVNTERAQIYCGLEGTMFLKGHEMLVAKIVPRQGKFSLETRLKIEGADGKYVYSNTFIDHLDSIPNKDLSDEDFALWVEKLIY